MCIAGRDGRRLDYPNDVFCACVLDTVSNQGYISQPRNGYSSHGKNQTDIYVGGRYLYNKLSYHFYDILLMFLALGRSTLEFYATCRFM